MLFLKQHPTNNHSPQKTLNRQIIYQELFYAIHCTPKITDLWGDTEKRENEI